MCLIFFRSETLLYRCVSSRDKMYSYSLTLRLTHVHHLGLYTLSILEPSFLILVWVHSVLYIFHKPCQDIVSQRYYMSNRYIYVHWAVAYTQAINWLTSCVLLHTSICLSSYIVYVISFNVFLQLFSHSLMRRQICKSESRCKVKCEIFLCFFFNTEPW